jgi:hypothetical protein
MSTDQYETVLRLFRTPNLLQIVHAINAINNDIKIHNETIYNEKKEKKKKTDDENAK